MKPGDNFFGVDRTCAVPFALRTTHDRRRTFRMRLADAWRAAVQAFKWGSP